VQPVVIWDEQGESRLSQVGLPLTSPPEVPVEIEIGFGKGRFLLAEAERHPERFFIGIESAAEYYRLLRHRATRRGLHNLVAVRGEALYVISCCLAPRCAQAVHVYFPDPWPKLRHHRRRLFDPRKIDLVLGLLAPGGRLFFATDHAEYGAAVLQLLSAHPATVVTRRDAPWPDGARTNYEAKYEAEGRPILRLEVTIEEGVDLLHPAAGTALVAPPLESEEAPA
jgi:tRNA (guanine-N7-)-methyltransferase